MPAIETNIETNAERLARVIDQTDPPVILVDLFDTLVTRSITGKQIKRVTSRFVKERFDLAASLEEVHQCRLDVEAELRSRARATGLDPEHRMDDLADGMWHRIGTLDGNGDPIDRATFRSAAIQIELAVERAAQTPDDDLIAVLRAATNRRVVLVSDFHLPTPWFLEMLDHHGISDLFDHVVVSADHTRSKASGRLYDHVLDHVVDRLLEIDPADRIALASPDGPNVLMVGDHPVSDGTMARDRGLVTCPIDRAPPARVNRIQRRVAESDFVRRRTLRRIVARQPAGFGELAITLYAFTRALHQRAIAEGADQLTFLAREGKILRLLFDRYVAMSPSVAERHIDSAYLFVSRRSTYLPSLRALDDEDFSRLLQLYPELTTADLLGNLGIEPDRQHIVLAEMRISGDEPLDLDALRHSSTFRAVYGDGRDVQRDRLTRLIDDLVGADTPLHLVDVGWKGTMQDHLQRIVGSSRLVTGYYLGIVPGRHMLGDGTKFGLLFDGRDGTSSAQRTLRHFKSLYEFLLQADHGSTRSYAERNGIVEAELDDQDVEARVYAEQIGPVQRQIEALFEEISRLDAIRERPLVGDLADVARYHSRMLYFPTRAEVERIMAIRHYENFGPLGFVGAVAAAQPSAKQKLRRAMVLASHPGRVVGRGWPPLTLAAAGLRPLIPVIGSYRWLRSRLDEIAASRDAG